MKDLCFKIITNSLIFIFLTDKKQFLNRFEMHVKHSVCFLQLCSNF